MSTVAGIFNSRADAERAVGRLREAGVAEDRISLLTPGTTQEQLDEVPTTETEQPGMGAALGGTVGGALGVAGGLHLGAAAASLLIPGVGPVLAAGLIGAALLGAGGAATGIAMGGALEDSMARGLPHDELFVYEDALRRGRSVVIVVADDDAQAETARGVLAGEGAESIDAARENWWLGLRDAEEAEYTVDGGDFGTDEPIYRRGFEAALHPRARDHSYEEDAERLRECYGGECDEGAFRQGYERGRRYHGEMLERHRA
ncbi:MAG: hypothetical protein DMF67_00855 [Acidobacteria bacterium]|nr:MAG: hypothetical protein DMF66_12865 [Acidobacteriota bacterium]PYS85531.1 MAG: hypothetical protein DMF67_00855 [Acidobacteriota bacterium]